MFQGTNPISSLSPGHELPSSHSPRHIQPCTAEQKGGQRTTTGSKRTHAKGQEHQKKIVPETMGKHENQLNIIEQCSKAKTVSLYTAWLRTGFPI